MKVNRNYYDIDTHWMSNMYIYIFPEKGILYYYDIKTHYMSNPKYLCVSFSSISMKIEDYIIIGIYFFSVEKLSSKYKGKLIKISMIKICEKSN